MNRPSDWRRVHSAANGFEPEREPIADEPMSELLVRSVQTLSTPGGDVWQVRTHPCMRCHAGHRLLVGPASAHPASDRERYRMPCGEEVLLMWPEPNILRAQRLILGNIKGSPELRRADENRRRSQRRFQRNREAAAKEEFAYKVIGLMREIARDEADHVFADFQLALFDSNSANVDRVIHDAKMRAEVLEAIPPLEIPKDFVSRVQEGAEATWTEYVEQREYELE